VIQILRKHNLGAFFVEKPTKKPSHDLTEHKNSPLNMIFLFKPENV